jgi:hypothetical protein
LRLNFNRFWNNHWTLYKNFNFIKFNFYEKFFNKFLQLFFRTNKFLKISFIFSNFKLLRSLNNLHIFIFFYESNLINFKEFSLNNKSQQQRNKWLQIKKIFFDTKLGLIKSFSKTSFNLLNLLNLFFFNYFMKFSKIFILFFIKHKKFFNKTLLFFILFLCNKSFNVNNFNEKRLNLLNFNNLQNYYKLFTIRKLIYNVIFKLDQKLLDKEKKTRLIFKILMKKIPNEFNSLCNLSLISLNFAINYSFTQFFNNKFYLKFINIPLKKAPISLFANLIAHRICLYGRPQNRYNKLTTSFFLPIFKVLINDETINGFKIILSGRINRRGRALWKKYNFKRIPKGSFYTKVEFIQQKIQTQNGILNLKIFLFRNSIFSNEISYLNYLLFNSTFLINNLFFSKYSFKLNNFLFNSNLFFFNKKENENNLHYKKRLKKLKRQYKKRSGFALL